MGASDLPGVAGLVVALVGAYFTYRASRDQNRTAAATAASTSRKDAVEGFDKLADDLRADLIACKQELRETIAELRTVRQADHDKAWRIEELERDNARLLAENRQLRGEPAT